MKRSDPLNIWHCTDLGTILYDPFSLCFNCVVTYVVTKRLTIHNNYSCKCCCLLHICSSWPIFHPPNFSSTLLYPILPCFPWFLLMILYFVFSPTLVSFVIISFPNCQGFFFVFFSCEHFKWLQQCLHAVCHWKHCSITKTKITVLWQLSVVIVVSYLNACVDGELSDSVLIGNEINVDSCPANTW